MALQLEGGLGHALWWSAQPEFFECMPQSASLAAGQSHASQLSAPGFQAMVARHGRGPMQSTKLALSAALGSEADS